MNNFLNESYEHAQKVPPEVILKLKFLWRNQVVMGKISSKYQKPFWSYKKQSLRGKGWEEMGAEAATGIVL